LSGNIVRVCVLILGLLVVAFGISLLFTPVETYAMVVMLIPIIVIMHGVSCLVTYMNTSAGQSASGWLLADGALSLIIGLWLLFTPNITAMALPMIFGFWLLFAGVLRIIGAITTMKIIKQWIWLLLWGVAGIVVGVFLLNHPVIAETVISYLTAICFILMGVQGILLFFVMKEGEIELEEIIPEPTVLPNVEKEEDAD